LALLSSSEANNIPKADLDMSRHVNIQVIAYRIVLIWILILVVNCGGGSGNSTNSNPVAESDSSDVLSPKNGIISLMASSHQMDQYFGASVTMGDFDSDGNMDMAVGAPFADIPISAAAPVDTGAVYIYYNLSSKSGNLSEANLVLRQSSDFNSQYGAALYADDIDGDGYDDLLVGSPYDDRAGTNTGSVYFYKGNASGLSHIPSEVFDNPTFAINQSFGSAIARANLDGDAFPELLIGAEANDAAGADRGGFWIFQGNSNNQYNFSAGIFIRDASALGAVNDFCGRALAVMDYNSDGNQDVIMGCSRDDTAGVDRGSIRIFFGTSVTGSWVVSAVAANAEIINPASTANTDYFGDSLLVADINGDSTQDLLVGAYLADSGVADNGLVYIFNSFTALNTSVDLIVSAPWSHSSAQRFGNSLSFADANGDGISDLAVGATGASLTGFLSGQVALFNASASGVINFGAESKFVAYDYHLEPEPGRFSANSDFGSSLCRIDFNRDGIQDLVVGSTTDDRKFTDDGSVSVFYGNENGTVSAKPDFVLVSPSPLISARQFGSSCLGLDVNGDDIEDLVVGAWQNDDVGAQSGSVYVYLGTATSTNVFPSFQINGPALAGYQFGSALAAGDLDNDGHDDLIVGAANADLVAVDRGAVYVFRSHNVTGVIDLLNFSTFQHTAGLTLDMLGASVLAFDYDGDGDADLLAGAPGDNDDGADAGMVYVWLNAGVADTLIDATHDLVILHPESNINSGFGSALHTGFYSNEDYPDLFIGASLDDINGANSGALFAYTGTANGFLTNPNVIYSYDAPATATTETFGASALVMDINNDGLTDLLTGAPQDDNFGFNSGVVYINLNP